MLPKPAAALAILIACVIGASDVSVVVGAITMRDTEGETCNKINMRTRKQVISHKYHLNVFGALENKADALENLARQKYESLLKLLAYKNN